MGNVKKSILIVLLFNHLLLGCYNGVFRKGDCGFDEKTCTGIGTRGHGYYEFVKTLHEAALAGDLELVQKIVYSGTPPYLTTPANQTALHYVALAKKPNIEVAKWLIAHRIDIHVMDSQGNTALSLAVERGHLDLIRLLLNFGASLNYKHPKNWSLVHLSAYHGQLVVVKYLVEEEKISPLTFDSEGNTALSLAVERGHLDLVNVLVKAGASLDFSHDKGWSLLHLAAFHGHLALVKYLVEEVKISPLTFDKQGNTALMLALGNKHEAIVSYLKKWTIGNLQAHTSVLKEEIKQRFGKQIDTSLKALCEHVGVDPAFISIDDLIDSSVRNIQAIVEGEEDTYVTPSNQLQEEDSEVQLQVSQILEELGKELQRYAIELPERSRKEFESKISVENLRPQLTNFVKQIKKAKEELAYFSQEQDKQTQERIDQINANSKRLDQQLKELEEQASIKKAQKMAEEETQGLYGLSTRNIAVPCMKHYFIPDNRCSNVGEIREYMEFIQENIAQNPHGTSLTWEQQKDLQSLLEQIYQEKEELTISYRDLKNYAEHRGGDQVFLEQAKKKRILMEFIQEAMTRNCINTLTDEQQEDLQVLLVQIYEDGEELIQSYKDIKNYVEYRGGYQEFLKRAKQKGILEEKAIKIEAACINGKLENTQLAKQLLEELQSLKNEAYKILKNNKDT